MNEDELKNIWQSEQKTPTIDFDALQNSFNDWQENLRRKIRIDIGVQIAGVATVLVLVWMYPELFFLFWVAIAIAVWYIRKILVFYRLEKDFVQGRGAKQFLNEKLRAMKSFINQTRLLMYVTPLVIAPATLYALGFFDAAAPISKQLISNIFPLAAGEITAIVLTEIYFKIFYAPAIGEIKDLLQQLNFDE
jgi:hypothetical protein